MTIHLTLEEATPLLRRAMGVPENTTFVIVAPATPAPSKPTTDRPILDHINTIGWMNYTTYQKIEAIKYLRTVTGLGLAPAKWAIENWIQFSYWVQSNLRWPVMMHDFHGGYKLS